MNVKNLDGAKLVKGGIFNDCRGTLKYFNDVDLSPVKRFYLMEHPDVNVVRAWQGHQVERKWFYVLSGSFKVVLVRPDHWTDPSTNLEHEEFLLESDMNQVLYIPGAYANGFQALVPESKMMIFSDASLEDSAADDYRFDKSMWYKW